MFEIYLPQVGKIVIVAPRNDLAALSQGPAKAEKWRRCAMFHKLRPPKEGQVGRIPAPWRPRSPETGVAGKTHCLRMRFLTAPQLARTGGAGAGKTLLQNCDKAQTNAAPTEPGASLNDGR